MEFCPLDSLIHVSFEAQVEYHFSPSTTDVRWVEKVKQGSIVVFWVLPIFAYDLSLFFCIASSPAFKLKKNKLVFLILLLLPSWLIEFFYIAPDYYNLIFFSFSFTDIKCFSEEQFEV